MYYVITPDSLLIKNTIFGEKQESFSLRGITSINCQQDFIPKILGYGNITIHFFGEASVTIKNIEEPGLTMSRVQELVNTGIIEDNNV